MNVCTAEYRTGWVGRGRAIHVLRLQSPDPFWRPLCSQKWPGSITTLSNPIVASDQAAELTFVGCSRCHAKFSHTPLAE